MENLKNRQKKKNVLIKRDKAILMAFLEFSVFENKYYMIKKS